jgi:hypothetical protein
MWREAEKPSMAVPMVGSMKIKDGFILKEVAGNFLVVPVGEQLVDFSKMVTVNETGAFLWQYLSEGETVESLTESILNEYDIDKDTAQKDIDEFVKLLSDNGIME